MKRRGIQISALLACGALMSGSGAFAAPTDRVEKSLGEPASSDLSAASHDLPQMFIAAKKKLDAIETVAVLIEEQKDDAEEDQDVVKMFCLGDKSDQLGVASNSATDRVKGIGAAAQSGNVQRALHDDMVLDALVGRAEELGAEANQCIGVELGSLNGSELNTTFDPGIPDGKVSDSSNSEQSENLPSVAATPEKGVAPGVVATILEIPIPSSPTL